MTSSKQSCLLLLLLTITFSKGQQFCNEQPTAECSCEMENSLKVINCRHKNLTQIPSFSPTTGIFDKIVFDSSTETGQCHSSLNCNNITSLPANAFANLKVKSIDLRNNPIVSFDDDAFAGLEDVLEELFVEGNGDDAPPYRPMARLQKLKSLLMENFLQDEITIQNSLLDFSNLQKLAIQKFSTLTRITAFPGLSEVSELTLKHLQKMTSIPVPFIQGMHKLQKLDISDSSIQAVFAETFLNLGMLTEITLERNKITTIYPTAFNGVTDKLQHLTLSYNQLHSDSLTFLNNTQWPNLTNLDLSYNIIAPISAMTFSTMPNLLYLNLQEVGLTRAENNVFQGLNNLHTLDLSYNLIQNVESAAFQSSPRLEELRLDNQNIKTNQILFNSNSFAGIETSLTTLWLENNYIDLDIFWNNVKKLTNLLTLNLPKMHILQIPDYAFQQNNKLTHIDLTLNNLTTLKQETFVGPKLTLVQINLESNNIEVLGDCFLADFPNKPNIILRNNRLRCDCQARWLYRWVMAQADTAAPYKIGTCASPPNLAGKFFNDFNETDICSGNYTPPQCPDLYLTTTTSTTPKPTTTTTQAVTRPMPTFTFEIGAKTKTSISVTWFPSSKTDVTAYKIELYSDDKPKQIFKIHRDEESRTFSNLRSGSYYTFCLIPEVNGVFYPDQNLCRRDQTYDEDYISTTVKPTITEASTDVNIPVIVGASVGSVILVIILVIIIYILCKPGKKKERTAMTSAVSYKPHAHAELPHAGGTARRFAKKPEKEGATPDDISINVISGSSMNKDRTSAMSAGSYQDLNYKVSPQTNGNPPTRTNGHYMNNMEERPLPNAPKGATGYVNDGFARETSSNTYNEVKY